MALGIGKHETSRLKDRAYKTIDEVLGSLKAEKKKTDKKKGLVKGKLKSTVQSTRDARAADNARAERDLEFYKEKLK